MVVQKTKSTYGLLLALVALAMTCTIVCMGNTGVAYAADKATSTEKQAVPAAEQAATTKAAASKATATSDKTTTKATTKATTTTKLTTQESGKTERETMDALAKANKDADGLEVGGKYLLRFTKTDDKVVDVSKSSKKNGATITTWASSMANNQQWRVKRDSKGYLTFINVNSGKALDLNSGKVTQYKYSKTDYGQKWVAVAYGSGFKLMNGQGDALCLTVAGGKTSNGAAIRATESKSSSAQRFDFLRVDIEYGIPQKKLSTINPNKWYELATDSKGKVVLDVANSSTESGANVGLWANKSGLNQLFKFSFVKTLGSYGYYRVLSAHSAKAISVKSGNLVPGTNIELAKKSSANSQLWNITLTSEGTYVLTSVASGLKLGSTGASSGDNVMTSEVPLELYIKERTNLLANGVYSLNCATKKTQVVDVSGGSTDDGAKAIIWSYGGGANQKWYVSAVEGKENVYTIESINSGKLLTASSSKSGASIKQREDRSSNLQRWTPIIVSTGQIVFANCANQKMALNLKGSKTSNGTKLNLYELTKSNAQRFVLQTVNIIERGTYFIRTALDPALVVDLSAPYKDNGSNVGIWSLNPEGSQGNQKWYITVNDNGTVSIKSCISGKAVAVSGGKAYNGANIVQWEAKNVKSQQWRVEYAPGTCSYRFVSNLNGNYAMEATTHYEGANLLLDKKSDNGLQRFTVEKTFYANVTPEQRPMYDRIANVGSSTDYIIAVDTKGCKTGVFKGSKGEWKLVRYESCATGAPGSDTITGTYTINYHQDSLSKYPEARFCTHITGEYFFHSILSSTSELGQRVSHGCIRLNWPFAQYMQTLPYGSTVVLY